jgi:hypothetical protein
MTFDLTHDMYTPGAINESVQAFREAISVTVNHLDGHSMLNIDSDDIDTAAEMLNYVLGLSARALLQRS